MTFFCDTYSYTSLREAPPTIPPSPPFPPFMTSKCRNDGLLGPVWGVCKQVQVMTFSTTGLIMTIGQKLTKWEQKKLKHIQHHHGLYHALLNMSYLSQWWESEGQPGAILKLLMRSFWCCRHSKQNQSKKSHPLQPGSFLSFLKKMKLEWHPSLASAHTWQNNMKQKTASKIAWASSTVHPTAKILSFSI